MENYTQIKRRSWAHVGGGWVALCSFYLREKNTVLFPHQKFVIHTPAKAIQKVQNTYGMVS